MVVVAFTVPCSRRGSRGRGGAGGVKSSAWVYLGHEDPSIKSSGGFRLVWESMLMHNFVFRHMCVFPISATLLRLCKFSSRGHYEEFQKKQSVLPRGKRSRIQAGQHWHLGLVIWSRIAKGIHFIDATIRVSLINDIILSWPSN